MVIDKPGFSAPRLAGILEITDEFFLFSVDANGREAFVSKLTTKLFNDPKLLVSGFGSAVGSILAVGFQRIAKLFEKTGNCAWGN